MSEVSENTVENTVENQAGVPASEQPQDTNNYEAMYQAAQSGNDKYINLEGKYGSNFEEKLEGFSEFEKQWTSDPKGTIENLKKQAGITVNEPQPQTQTPVGELNLWELGQDGSQANKWLDDKVSAKAKVIVDETIGKFKDEQQVNDWRRQLNNEGITDHKKQNEAIREFLNPNPNFSQFLQGKVSAGNPQGVQTPRPSEVMQQVSHSQTQPQTTGVLQGGGIPQQKSWSEERADAVMDIAKKKRGNENF